MYSRNQKSGDHIVSIGVPQGGWKGSGKCVLESWDAANVSKIGGYAVWHDSSTAPSLEDLRCRVCGSADNVVLVAQIYSPVDELERSVYIFCCNTRACSLCSNGWTVLRNQIEASAAPTTCEPVKHTEIAAATAAAVSAVATTKSSVWDFLSDDLGNNTGDDDLMALLEMRDLNLTVAPKADINTTKVPQSQIRNSTQIDTRTFLVTNTALPVCKIRAVDEDWVEDEGDLIAADGNAMDSSHINSLLARYLRDEDEEEHLRSLQALGIHSGSVCTNPQRLKCDDGEADGDDSDDDSAEDAQARAKIDSVEEYFQRRIRAEPKQVLRCAFEGQPLWISAHNKAMQTNIPMCEGCGSERVFEFQLMPALLSHMSKYSAGKHQIGEKQKASAVTAMDELTATVHVDSKGSARVDPVQQRRIDMALLGEGLDFGVVAVWCCSENCGEGHNREFTIMQPPPDIGL